MKKAWSLPLLLASLLALGGCPGKKSPTSTGPSATRTPTATGTSTFSPSATPSVTPTPTESPTLTPTSTGTSTLTESPTPTGTSTSTLTPTSTPTLTATSTRTLTPTLTDTPTATLTSTLTATPSPTPSPTLTETPTVTPTPNYSGTWSLSSLVSLQCNNVLGSYVVNFNFISLMVTESYPNITFKATGNPGTLFGSLGPTGNFSTQSSTGSPCLETYTLNGSFLTANSFSATFTASFSGSSCGDCTLHSWVLSGTKP